ncbi:DUF1129 domain-containing protein [Enterococcus timonensis]|uniref:DUF1129 domain-containing protein n=1 Tax=Enterococcus timonensis TaxID=1852364 RepID=UPI0008DB27DC|nr:DUF1129 domain-containing protein [Enterococcus timonensis]
MDGEQIRQMVADNRENEAKLTKRNEQYIFDFKKALKAANFTEEETIVALHDMLPELVAGQKSGVTARQQFGTVTERVTAILAKPRAADETAPWKLWLDNTMLFLAMLTVLNGVMNLFAQGQQITSGITSIVLTSMMGGIIFYYMYKWIYKFQRPGADQSQKPKLWKSMSILAVGMVAWIVVYTGSMLLPPIVNPTLQPIPLIIVGAVAFAGRWYFKKTNNIKGSFFNRD